MALVLVDQNSQSGCEGVNVPAIPELPTPSSFVIESWLCRIETPIPSWQQRVLSYHHHRPDRGLFLLAPIHGYKFRLFQVDKPDDVRKTQIKHIRLDRRTSREFTGQPRC